jgi:predicted nucleic acid-binding protein
MGQKYLIDTCAVIKYLEEVFPLAALTYMDTIIDEDCKVSFITKIELLVWNPQNPNDINIRKAFIAGSEIHFIDDEIIDKATLIRKKTNIKLPDAVIAATAIVNNFILLSDNDIDFKKVESLGLNYLNPKLAFR